MAVEELAVFVLSLVPFLNTGLIVLSIDLALGKLGFQVTRRSYRRKPMESLLWGLCLILVSSLLSLLIQSQLLEFQPFLVFVILLGIYLVLTQT